MALVAEGLSNEEIAQLLVVSPATAKTHVSRAMVKLHARDRAQLVVYAYESGLVQPGHLRPGRESSGGGAAPRSSGRPAALHHNIPAQAAVRTSPTAIETPRAPPVNPG